jgi:hypothetical protein
MKVRGNPRGGKAGADRLQSRLIRVAGPDVAIACDEKS